MKRWNDDTLNTVVINVQNLSKESNGWNMDDMEKLCEFYFMNTIFEYLRRSSKKKWAQGRIVALQ